MSRKKLRRAAKIAAGIGAAYLGSKMLGSKMEQMKRAKGIGTSVDMDTEFKGKVSNLTRKGMRREMEDSKIMPKAKPTVTKTMKPKKFLGMNFGVSQKPSNLEAFKEAEKQRRLKTGFGRNVGKRSTGYSGLGLGSMDGAKTGKFVTTKCKLGRNKKTKLS